VACVIFSLVILAFAGYGFVQLVRKCIASDAGHPTKPPPIEADYPRPAPARLDAWALMQDQAADDLVIPADGFQNVQPNGYDVLWTRQPDSDRWAAQLVKHPEVKS